MRLFIAVELERSVVAAALDAGEELRRRADGHVRASWIRAENMHLTVRFIGEAKGPQVAAVVAALQPPLALSAFDLALGSCGAFPSATRPRVIWIGLARGADELRKMHDEFNRRLRPLGFEPEDRAFNAHLTLARVKETHPNAGPALRDAIAAVPVAPAHCVIDAATLFQSQLSPRDARYTPLLTVKCAGR